ncbi:F-box/kelch-repeat protein At3g23880-like [Bidens hawaiensis]|uniref:F-box/kelch-repeat protein At3g23880-like n=1 Tax=Bidens hawaiensis TaxID=980011 RepID=UPI0040490C99
MAEVVNEDVVEQILIALDANDLIRYKSVCKAWYSLITSPRFVKRHLNHSYNKDYSNKKLCYRRVSLLMDSANAKHYFLVGSFNGLVCVKYLRTKFMVGNPVTREVRQLAYPSYTGGEPFCWGFGYDSSSDDYKVIVVARKGNNQICFRLLSLKSNVWREVGEQNYVRIYKKAGVLCNGALHWIILDRNYKKIIVSYDLSKEKFKENHLPRGTKFLDINLGNYRRTFVRIWMCFLDDGVWLIIKENAKESWEPIKNPYDGMKYDIVHALRSGFVKDGDALWVSHASKHLCWKYFGEPVFVSSLVSPHHSAT